MIERTTLGPAARLLQSRLMRRSPDIWDLATRTWDVAPGFEAHPPPAIALPGQLDRVTGWIFGEEADQRRDLAGGAIWHGPTRACLVEDAYLLDGTIHAGASRTCLQPRTRLWAGLRVDEEVARGAVYASFPGNKWFGMWLMDDCPRYLLAAAEGTPVTTVRPLSEHTRTYERWLGMRPLRAERAHFRELLLFDDVGQNASKRARFAAMRERVLARVKGAPHPGVFLLRGLAGERRVLEGELELAERLRTQRGFRVIDPLTLPLPEVLGACAGAAVVMGVEGSALMHGVITMRPGACMFVLEPPDRFCSLFKHLADRDGQRFAFVVGKPAGGGSFRVETDEVERTLDLVG